mmetsp:Transcript_98220/g.174867  ORF Transcript_98220/g.174867 Transcript_98220/m.174867 type:complete len:115 (-) Transcript_98220:8-352(-)
MRVQTLRAEAAATGSEELTTNSFASQNLLFLSMSEVALITFLAASLEPEFADQSFVAARHLAKRKSPRRYCLCLRMLQLNECFQINRNSLASCVGLGITTRWFRSAVKEAEPKA